jgi:hypothetical protein
MRDRRHGDAMLVRRTQQPARVALALARRAMLDDVVLAPAANLGHGALKLDPCGMSCRVGIEAQLTGAVVEIGEQDYVSAEALDPRRDLAERVLVGIAQPGEDRVDLRGSGYTSHGKDR